MPEATPSQSKTQWFHWLALGLILLLALALRLHKLDAQSLWYDEGNSARIAERSLQLIYEGAAGDIHPPLYYFILHFWRDVFGASEWSLRLFSVLCGMLVVLFAYLIGRDAFDPRVGLVAAAFVAVSPFAIYYSQEVRMYELLAAEAAASTWALIKLRQLDVDRRERSPRRSDPQRSWHWHGAESVPYTLVCAVYVVATAAGLYTQYAYPFVMIAQGVVILAFWISDFRLTSRPNPKSKIQNLKSTSICAILTLAAIALFLPWLPIAVRQVTGWTVERQAYAAGAALLDVYRWLIVGRTLPLTLSESALPLIMFGSLALIGLFARDIRDRRQSSTVNRLAMLVLAVLPLALLFIFNLYRDAYVKFLLVCMLPLFVLAARGLVVIGYWLLAISNRSLVSSQPVVDRLSSVVIMVLTALACALFTPSLRNLYDNPAYARDDYRGIQRMIASNARAGDAVLFIAPNQWEVYTYYQGNDKDLYPLKYRPIDGREVAHQLEQIAGSHQRLFVLYYAEREADPDDWYERWLAENTNKVDEQWIGNIRLAVYGAGSRGLRTWKWPLTGEDVMFGDSIRLDDVRASLGPTSIRVGDVLPIDLVWQASAKPDQRYKVFIHIGPPDAPPVAQNDSEPVAGFRPTDSWNPDEEIVDRRGVWIKSGTPPGRYGVYVGMYDGATGERLPITQNGQPVGDRLKLGEVNIIE